MKCNQLTRPRLAWEVAKDEDDEVKESRIPESIQVKFWILCLTFIFLLLLLLLQCVVCRWKSLTLRYCWLREGSVEIKSFRENSKRECTERELRGWFFCRVLLLINDLRGWWLYRGWILTNSDIGIRTGSYLLGQG